MIIANYEYELQMAACGNTVACKYDMNVWNKYSKKENINRWESNETSVSFT
jgi:hypothetical protein